MPRTTGVRNRNYPGLVLDEALTIPRAIQDDASGRPVSKLTLAGLMGSTPGSSTFRDLLLASRAYGLTTGGVNGDEFGLSELGGLATSDDVPTQRAAYRSAVMNVSPFRAFLTQYDGKKVPSEPAFVEFLVKSAAVPEEWAQQCMEHIIADARFIGALSELKGSEYVDLKGASAGQSFPERVTDCDDDSVLPQQSMDEGRTEQSHTGNARVENVPRVAPPRRCSLPTERIENRSINLR